MMSWADCVFSIKDVSFKELVTTESLKLLVFVFRVRGLVFFQSTSKIIRAQERISGYAWKPANDDLFLDGKVVVLRLQSLKHNVKQVETNITGSR